MTPPYKTLSKQSDELKFAIMHCGCGENREKLLAIP